MELLPLHSAYNQILAHWFSPATPKCELLTSGLWLSLKSTLGEERTTLFVIVFAVLILIACIIARKIAERNYRKTFEAFSKEVNNLWESGNDADPAGKDHLSLLMLTNMRQDFSESKKSRNYFIGLLHWLKREHFLTDKKLMQQFISETIRLFKKK